MNVIETALQGVLITEPKAFGDARSFFMKTDQAQRYQDASTQGDFIQDNHSRSQLGVLRGLHKQEEKTHDKLVRCLRGDVFDAAADFSSSLRTLGKYVGLHLSDENDRQFWILPGYLHRFVTRSEIVDFEYKCTTYYDPSLEIGLALERPRSRH
ncbi:MAG: dTDP-4-dehydrorhamnose 3,5-epimerase family protein [Pseudomonadota bacterium]